MDWYLGAENLSFRGQVDPQLDAVEHPATLDEFGGGRLDVQDAGARGHPLGGAVGDQTAAAVRILVGETAVDHVGDCLEAAVRVPVGAARLARLVFDLAHLVHVDERVEVGGADAGERAHDGEALAFVPARSGGNRPHGTFGVGRVRRGDARQCQGVCGDGMASDTSMC